MQAVREAVAVQAHGFAQILQFTVAVAGAGYAFLIMIGKNHFHLYALHVAHMFGEGINPHAFFHGRIAGGNHARALRVAHFRKADPTGRGLVPERLETTQRGNENSIAAGDVQNGFARFKVIFLSVDECFHRKFLIWSGVLRTWAEQGPCIWPRLYASAPGMGEAVSTESTR